MDDTLQFTVPFRDVDMHGHVHNSVHLAYFEAAVSHFLRTNNLSVHFDPAGPLVWHVRKAEVTFHAPTRYDDAIRLSCVPAYLGRTSLRFDGRMTGVAQGDLRATAEILWVCVDPRAGRAVAVREDVRAAIGAYLPDDQSG